jgi:hypothetical protein
MARKNIFDLETAVAGISAVVSPNPYTVGNLVSHLTTGQSLGANLPGAAGQTVRNVEGAVQDAVGKAAKGGAKKSKKNTAGRRDYGAAAAYGVGSEGQRRAEARAMKRNEAFSRGGVVSHKSVSACENSMGKSKR